MLFGRTGGLIVAALVVSSCVMGTWVAFGASPQQDFKAANEGIQRALTAARGGNLTAARQAYDQYENTWFDVEVGVRSSSRDSYVAIEKAMSGVSAAFAATPP